MKTMNLVIDMYERNHKSSWWTLSEEDKRNYFNKNSTKALLNYYKKLGMIHYRLICSSKQKTKFGDNSVRVEQFEKYIRDNGYSCITFPYSQKCIHDTTFSVEVPWENIKKFKEILAYFEVIDVSII